MTIKPFKFSDLDKWSGLVLGEAGSGKTTLISTIPEDQNIMVFSVESGMLAIRDTILSRPKTMSVCTMEKWMDMDEAIAKLNSTAMQNKFDWVIFDSLTAIGDVCLKEMKKRSKNGFEAYERLGISMLDAITQIRDMPYNTIFTCLVLIKDGVENEKNYLPQVPGSVVTNRLTSLFDEVLFLTSKTKLADGHREIITDSYEGFPGKDRSGKLDYIELPDLWHISQKILGKNNEEGETTDAG
jgi:phage nucleotide-binding protein